MGTTDVLEFGFGNLGKPLLLSLLDNGDPRDYSSGKAFLIDLLGGNNELKAAIADIKDLQKDVARMSIRLDELDKKLEWYHRNDVIFPAISATKDQFDLLQRFMDDKSNLGEDGLKAALRNDFDAAGFDSHLRLMHRVILDLDEDDQPRSQHTIFDAYEAYMCFNAPEIVDLGNPRRYFFSRLKVFQHYANAQRKAATLAALHFRSTNFDAEADRLEVLVERNLRQQYNGFLESMPLYAKLAAVSDGLMRFVQDEFVLKGTAGSLNDGRVHDGDTLIPSVPGFAVQTRADSTLNLLNKPRWLLQESGEDDLGIVFDLYVQGEVNGKTHLWSTYFSDPQKVYKGRLSNNQVTFEKRPLLMTGNRVDGQKTDFSFAGITFASVVDVASRAAPPGGRETVRISLGLVTPTIREAKAEDTSGRSSEAKPASGDANRDKNVKGKHCDDVSKTFDGVFRVRLGERSTRGKPGAAIVRRSRRTGGGGDFVYSYEDRVDRNPWQAGQGEDCRWVTKSFEGMDPTPATPEDGLIVGWLGLLEFNPDAVARWGQGRKVRYRILAENIVARARDYALVAGGDNMNARDEEFVQPPAGKYRAQIGFIVEDDPKIQFYRLYRQFEDESDFAEVTRMTIVPIPSVGDGKRGFWLVDDTR